MNERLTKTGRTTRMLAYADQCLRDGMKVVIVGQGSSQITALTALFHKNHKNLNYGNRLAFWPAYSTRIDWENWRVLVNQDCVLLVDHYVLEYKLARMIKEMHRFDSPEIPNDKKSNANKLPKT